MSKKFDVSTMKNTVSSKKSIFKNHKKKCQFKDCGNEYYGTSKSKYCAEHRKPIYRKIIDFEKNQAKKKYIEENNPNQIIKHSFKEPKVIIQTCQNPVCKKEFEILIYPLTYVYPKYCSFCRNEYRRKRSLEQLKEIV